MLFLLFRFLFIVSIVFLCIAFYISYNKGDDIYDVVDEITTNFLTNKESGEEDK